MAKKAKPTSGAGAKVAAAGLASLLGAGRANPFVPSPQSNYNPMRPTPLTTPAPKRKGKGK